MAAGRRAVVGHVSVIWGSQANVAELLQAGATDALIIVGAESASLRIAASCFSSLSRA